MEKSSNSKLQMGTVVLHYTLSMALFYCFPDQSFRDRTVNYCGQLACSSVEGEQLSSISGYTELKYG